MDVLGIFCLVILNSCLLVCSSRYAPDVQYRSLTTNIVDVLQVKIYLLSNTEIQL